MPISEIDRLRAEVAALRMSTEAMGRSRTGADVDAMKATQARCDAALAPFGERATEPTLMDSPTSYRGRMFQRLAKHTERFRGNRFDSAAAEILDAVEPHLFAAVQDAVRNDANARPGTLIPIRSQDEAGRTITKFEGDIAAFMAPYMVGATVCTLNRKPAGEG